MRSHLSKLGLLLTPMALAILVACASPPSIDPSKVPSPPSAFREADGRWIAAAPADAQPRGEWWKAFDDPVLDELMSRALARNDRIQIATARLQHAKALVRGTDAERLPQVGASAGAFRGTQPQTGTRPLTLLTAGAGLTYEVDLLGKLSRSTD